MESRKDEAILILKVFAALCDNEDQADEYRKAYRELEGNELRDNWGRPGGYVPGS